MPPIRGGDGAAPASPLLVSRYRVVASTSDGERSMEQQSIAAARALLQQWAAQGIAARLKVICVSPRSFAGEPGIVAHHLRREGLWVYALPEELATCLLHAERPNQDWNLLLERLTAWDPAHSDHIARLCDIDPDLQSALESRPIPFVASIDEADAVFRAIPLLGVIARVPLHIPATWPEPRDQHG